MRPPGNALTYPGVGGTRDATVPAGFRWRERSAPIGHGDEHWRFAREEVLTWGVKRRSGFRVRAPGEVREGDDATLHFGPLREPVRVVYVVDEPDRCGFGYGTLPGHPVSGEECFVVERRVDGTVWIVVRSFSRAGSPAWAVLMPLVRVAQTILTRRYLRVLA